MLRQIAVPEPRVRGDASASTERAHDLSHADCVLMLYRDDHYDRDSERPGEMDITVRKNWQGRLDHVASRIDSRLRYLPSSSAAAPALGNGK